MRMAPKLVLDLYLIWASAPAGRPTSLRQGKKLAHRYVATSRAGAAIFNRCDVPEVPCYLRGIEGVSLTVSAHSHPQSIVLRLCSYEVSIQYPTAPSSSARARAV